MSGVGGVGGTGGVSGVVLREMRWWDLDGVLALEHRLFPEDAWSRGLFWSELADARHPAATRTYLVAEAPVRSGLPLSPSANDLVPQPPTPGARASARQGGRIVGYAGLAVVAGTGDVQTIATARDHWGTGLGARLLTALLRAATAAECHEVLLEVRVDNARAQRLYQRFGFEPIGFRKGYYQPGNVDALVMRLADPATQYESTDPAVPHAADLGAVHEPAAPAPAVQETEIHG